MSKQYKDIQAILEKLNIEALNEMQNETIKAFEIYKEVVVLSPTGSGKTLAFLLPIIENLDPNSEEIQALILVPSRELAIQIEQVLREIGSGYKVNAVYGGRSGSKDRIELQHSPAILIGTPGRVADHFRNEVISSDYIKNLVVDEFDKALEVGFEEEMKEIIQALGSLDKKILTSATKKVDIPDFMQIKNPKYLNFLKDDTSKLQIKIVDSKERDKLDTLGKLIASFGESRGIVFCNFKDSIEIVSEYFDKKGIDHSVFHGGLEQLDRERSLIRFRNGSSSILLGSDLAARGIDVPEIDFIIHFELPPKPDEFVHRNGRTARMNAEGTAYVLKDKWESLPNFMHGYDSIALRSKSTPKSSKWTTLYISGGRKDKISKGDIAGLFFKQGNLNKDELGVIEIKPDSSYVGVLKSKAPVLVKTLNNSKLKKKKVRISELR